MGVEGYFGGVGGLFLPDRICDRGGEERGETMVGSGSPGGLGAARLVTPEALREGGGSSLDGGRVGVGLGTGGLVCWRKGDARVS